jgi:hypothetical protein
VCAYLKQTNSRPRAFDDFQRVNFCSRMIPRNDNFELLLGGWVRGAQNKPKNMSFSRRVINNWVPDFATTH